MACVVTGARLTAGHGAVWACFNCHSQLLPFRRARPSCFNVVQSPWLRTQNLCSAGPRTSPGACGSASRSSGRAVGEQPEVNKPERGLDFAAEDTLVLLLRTFRERVRDDTRYASTRA